MAQLAPMRGVGGVGGVGGVARARRGMGVLSGKIGVMASEMVSET